MERHRDNRTINELIDTLWNVNAVSGSLTAVSLHLN